MLHQFFGTAFSFIFFTSPMLAGGMSAGNVGFTTDLNNQEVLIATHSREVINTKALIYIGVIENAETPLEIYKDPDTQEIFVFTYDKDEE